MLFRTKHQQGVSDDTYLGLRTGILHLDPTEAGLEATKEFPRVYGVVLETGHPHGVATLVSFSDGTASLYLSSGGGIIGGGSHPGVAAASLALIRMAEESFDLMATSTDDGLPRSGMASIRALAFPEHRAIEASQDDLGYGRHKLSPLFHAAQEVITQLRLLNENRPAAG